jgi:predicted DNA-binding transcriptional regulator YafY
MDRTERFYKIERLLRDHKRVTRRQLLEALEVSLATLKRDLAYMRDRLHAPIVWNADTRAYELQSEPGAPAYELPGLWFNPSEIYALMTMDTLLSEMQPGLLAAHIAPLRARLEMLLEEGRVGAAEVRRRIRIRRHAARLPAAHIFETVAAATLRRLRLRIRYAGRASGERTERVISPQRLVHYRDNWYVDAYCHLREGLRKFAIDAIAAAELQDEPAKDVDLAEIERELDRGYGVFGGTPIDWASLRFSADRARWVASEQWHPLQRGHFEPKGSYLLEVPFSDPRELLMDVLKFGADVEVVGPPSLRHEWARQVRAMAASVDLGESTNDAPRHLTG